MFHWVFEKCSSDLEITLKVFCQRHIQNLYQYLRWSLLQQQLLSQRAPSQMLVGVPNLVLSSTLGNKSAITFNENNVHAQLLRQHSKLKTTLNILRPIIGIEYWDLRINLSWWYSQNQKFSWWYWFIFLFKKNASFICNKWFYFEQMLSGKRSSQTGCPVALMFTSDTGDFFPCNTLCPPLIYTPCFEPTSNFITDHHNSDDFINK